MTFGTRHGAKLVSGFRESQDLSSRCSHAGEGTDERRQCLHMMAA